MNITSKEINRTIIIAEVTSAFYQYEEALINNNISVLNNLFWHDTCAVRFGITENLYGIKQIQNFRKNRSTIGLDRTLRNTIITTFSDNYAVCSTEFIRKNTQKIGRQQQTWVKMPHGWCIVAAQVSLMS